MSTAEIPGHATTDPSVVHVDLALETAVIAVSDVDRAKAFYGGLGWRLDADLGAAASAIVQFTRPVRGARSSSAPGSRRPRPVRPQPARRVRHRGRAPRARCARRRRASVFHDATGGYNRFDPERPGEGSRPRATDVRVVRRVPRPGRERVAAAGDHQPAARPRRRRRRDVPPSTSSRARSTRAEAAHGEHEKRTVSGTRTGPPGTPRTCWRSRPEPSRRT